MSGAQSGETSAYHYYVSLACGYGHVSLPEIDGVSCFGRHARIWGNQC